MIGYTTMDRIFSKLNRDITDKYSEGDIIEWTGEALEFMQAVKSYEEAVAFQEVVNHQCDIPKRTHNIIQIGRKNNWTKDCCTPAVITSEVSGDDCYVQKPTVNNYNPCLCPFDDAVWLDCNGQPIVAYDLAYYRPYFDLKAEYYGWSNTKYYKQNFTPVRLKTSSFFDSLVCSTEQENNPYTVTKDEYTIIQKSKLRFSFDCGFVAIAYTRQSVDEKTGYPLIPDNISHITAVVAYINMMITKKEMYSHRDGAMGLYKVAADDWNWYCAQASSADKMPNGIDEHQNLLDQRGYLLPRNNSYFNFFGNLNEAEYRKWNHR